MNSRLRAVAFAVLALVTNGLQAGEISASLSGGTDCTTATRALVRTFVRDYSAGRVVAANALWAPAPRFRWFSSGPPGSPGERLGPAAYRRSTLATYFRSRVDVHERIRLTELRARYDVQRKIVNFNGKLVRRADDIHARGPQDFKGAADCESSAPRLIVWSM